MALNPELAIRIEEYSPPSRATTNRKPLKVYIFTCRQCHSGIRCVQSYLLKHSGLCVPCSAKITVKTAIASITLRPFEASYNRIKDSAIKRNMRFDLDYDYFLSLTKIVSCHYCHRPIQWKSYGHSGYNLDRVNNNIGYNNSNVVVCCGRCNKGKNATYSYEEWRGMTEYFRKAP